MPIKLSICYASAIIVIISIVGMIAHKNSTYSYVDIIMDLCIVMLSVTNLWFIFKYKTQPLPEPNKKCPAELKAITENIEFLESKILEFERLLNVVIERAAIFESLNSSIDKVNSTVSGIADQLKHINEK